MSKKGSKGEGSQSQTRGAGRKDAGGYKSNANPKEKSTREPRKKKEGWGKKPTQGWPGSSGVPDDGESPIEYLY